MNGSLKMINYDVYVSFSRQANYVNKHGIVDYLNSIPGINAHAYWGGGYDIKEQLINKDVLIIVPPSEISPFDNCVRVGRGNYQEARYFHAKYNRPVYIYQNGTPGTQNKNYLRKLVSFELNQGDNYQDWGTLEFGGKQFIMKNKLIPITINDVDSNEAKVRIVKSTPHAHLIAARKLNLI